MDNQLNDVNATVKVYHGYGHKGNLIIYGHVIAGKKTVQTKFKKNAVLNIVHLIKLFFMRKIIKNCVILRSCIRLKNPAIDRVLSVYEALYTKPQFCLLLKFATNN